MARRTIGLLLVLALLGVAGAPPSFSVSGADELLDLHGSPCDAQLAPGILARQLRAGSLQLGSLSVGMTPDIFMAGKRRMDDVVVFGLVNNPIEYATNVLAIAVRTGNPKHVESLRDLGRLDVRVAMPNPASEGVARQIELAYQKAGGEPTEPRC